MLLLVATLATTALLTACDAFYQLTVENHQARDVRIIIDGRDMRSVSACTSHTYGNLPIERGRPSMRVEAVDSQGLAVYVTTINPQAGAAGLDKITISIPEQSPGECPSPLPTAVPTRSDAK